jgi:hypothetical protein
MSHTVPFILSYPCAGKMRPVETIPGMGGEGLEEVNVTMIFYKNFL